MWDEITYPFLNFNGAAAEVWEWINILLGMLITYAGIKVNPC